MNRRSSVVRPGWFSLLAIVAGVIAWAETVKWQIDSSRSYVRLTIPDQNVQVPELGEVTVKLRNADSNSQWTDSGGRRAALEGEIVTEYMDGVALRFVSGAHHIRAIEQTSLRPNPEAWDAQTASYTNASTAPAALGARVRATFLILTFDVAFVAFRNISMDLGNPTGLPILLCNGALSPNTTICGVAGATVDIDGVELPLELGQPIPDTRGAEIPFLAVTNSIDGEIASLGGQNRQLTIHIAITDFPVQSEDVSLKGTAEVQIVAVATVPEPEPAPFMTIEALPGAVVISWPTNSASYVLECARAIPTTNWTLVPITPAIVTDKFVVTNVVVGEALLYRLVYPVMLTGLPFDLPIKTKAGLD